MTVKIEKLSKMGGQIMIRNPLVGDVDRIMAPSGEQDKNQLCAPRSPPAWYRSWYHYTTASTWESVLGTYEFLAFAGRCHSQLRLLIADIWQYRTVYDVMCQFFFIVA